MFRVRLLALVLGFMLILVGNSFGQTGIAPAPLRPNATPTVSPYLFLGDGRFPAALNYYQRVRPQRQIQQTNQRQYRDIQTLNREVTVLQQREEARVRGELPPTGHRSYFYSPGTYFQSTGRYFDRDIYQSRPTAGRR